MIQKKLNLWKTKHPRIMKNLRKVSRIIPDKVFIELQYRRHVGKAIDWENPQTFTEKLQWLKLYWHDPLAEICADKYSVRKYIEKNIGKDYMTELYGVYSEAEELVISELPDSFVLKGTHGSSMNLICNNEQLDWHSELLKINEWLRTNYYNGNREWVYKNLKPRILCEEYLYDSEGKPPMDYKIFCFHGEPKLIQVDVDRFGEHKQNFYDIDWNFRDIKIWCDNDKEIDIPKPENYDEMIEISRVLSKYFPHVRVDLYNIEGRIVFGELTFFHLSGIVKYIDESLNVEMGNWLDLGSIDENGVYKVQNA